MVQACEEVSDFSYGAACDAAGLPARIAVFANNAYTRSQITDDLEGAGFRCVDGGAIAMLLDGPITMLGDLVMMDCLPASGGGLDARTMAALTRLDMRVAKSGAHLIVTTSMEALDDVFAALDQSGAQILVEPSRAERVVAVGRVMSLVATGASRRVREMSEQDRTALIHLSQQVDAIAQQLDRISNLKERHDGRLSDAKRGYDAGAGGDTGAAFSFAEHARKAKAPDLPDPRAVRRVIAAREARARFFNADLFSDPAWDMLLDLTAAHAENARVSVTSLCIAARVPATTALRWVNQMVDCGIFERVADDLDRRRAFIRLSNGSVDAMSRYFAEVELPLAQAA